MEPEKTRTRRKRIKKYLPIILILLVVLLALSTAYFYKKSTSGDAQARASMAQVRSLTKKVGRHMVLPENETPTIATVSDPEALRDQTFFTNAKVGDKVLIYSAARTAILYDPKSDKIITIAPLNIDGDVTSTPATNSPGQ